MEPLVSVIIPVYNVLPYLREALDSVINQTYKNLEILVVDDGSTDGSGEVCNEYLSDPRVIVIHQENKGLSGARNTGLDRMTGEYVAFLDSDDAFMPDMIEKMLDALIRNRADISVCGYDICFTRQNMRTNRIKRKKVELFNKEMLLPSTTALKLMVSGKTGWAVWNKIYHRHIWDYLRFPEAVNYEDMQVDCLVFEKSSKIVVIPCSLILYRNRTGSISSSFCEKSFQDYVAAFNMVETYVISHTPTVFSYEYLILLQEQFARIMSFQYAQLLQKKNSYNVIALAKQEAVHRWDMLGKKLMLTQSKVTRFLFFNIPHLLIAIRSCWQFGTKLLERLNLL